MTEKHAAVESLESAFNFSAVTSCPVTTGMCGKKLAGHCTMRTYGASAEKLCEPDNISTKKKQKNL